MRKIGWVMVLAAAGCVGMSALTAQAGDDQKPAETAAPAATAEKPAKKAKTVRLTKPWSGITSLTDEQRTQIAEIHKKSVADVQEIQKLERDAIMAVLNDQQKAEVAAATEKQAIEKKMKKETEAQSSAAPKTPEKGS